MPSPPQVKAPMDPLMHPGFSSLPGLGFMPAPSGGVLPPTRRQLHADKDREVVRRSSRPVAVEGDLAREGPRLELLVAPLDGRAVGRSQHPVGADLDRGGDEDVVNPARGHGLGVEIVEGAVGGVASFGRLVRIAQRLGAGQQRIDCIGLVDVEVARKETALARRAHRADAFKDQTAALGARPDADMVQVEVEEVEDNAALPVAEPAPRTDAGQRRIPPHARPPGTLREPEMAFIEQFEALAEVENRGILPLRRPVVAADANIGIVGQPVEHVVQLVVEHLLCAEDVEAL